MSLHPEILPASTDTGPHWNDEAEQNCLALVLMNAKAATMLTGELQPGDFYRPQHQRIFAAAQKVLEEGGQVDAVVLSEYLQTDPEFRQDGGPSYLRALAGLPAFVTHAGEYARIVREHARKREAARIGEALSAGRIAPSQAAELLQEMAPPAVASPFVTGLELAQRAVAELVAVVPPYIWAGMVTELVGRVKGGKTTAAQGMSHAVVTGEPFLGQPTLQGPVIYLTEQNEPSFRAQLDRAHLLGCPDLHILFRHEWRGDWPTTGAVVKRHAAAIEARLVIVDTLSEWARIGRDEENDAGAAMEAMRPLHEIAAAGPAVLCLRHERKGGGEIGENARGSSAFGGSADVLMTLRRMTSPGHENRRELLAVGRVEVPAKVIIEYEAGEYRLLGDGDELERQEARRRLLEVLPSRPEYALTTDTLTQRCETTKATLNRALAELHTEGTVERDKGAGEASSRAFGYWKAEVER